ncbi:MAG TPA: TonB-dependent receptor [Candidatus Acidoferrales bacterium]|nr:TonB-dependent receptor [Candidatus Acidoferrales bacterium]
MKSEYTLGIAKRSLAVRFAVTAFAVLAALFLFSPVSHAQITGTITGTVSDSSGAVVPGASVSLMNEASKDIRGTVSDSSGYFAFAGVLPGTYTVRVESKGFKAYQQSSVSLEASDKRNVNITLAVGQTTETVTVEAHTDLVPVDSGARSFDLTSQDFQRLPMISRNASELLMSLPGAVVTPNGNSSSAQGGMDFTQSGSVGSSIGNGVSISGAPYRGGTALLMDGTNIIDEGCDCTSIAVPNPDMVQEVKVQTSAFGADGAKGPVVVDFISKSGGAQYHGEGYLFVRNAIFNSDSWQLNQAGQNVQTGDHYYYPGGNFGGPIPGMKKKLFFWFGYEHFYQLATGGTIDESYVPTADMAAGNFGPTAANNALCMADKGVPADSTAIVAAGTYCYDPTTGAGRGGAAIGNANLTMNGAGATPDAGGLALMAMIQKWDAPNADPTKISGGYNYFLPVPARHNGYLYRGRGDYDLNENNKIFVTYQYASDAQPSDGNSHMWWLPGDSVQFPGGGLTQAQQAKTITGNFLHVFNATLTNQATAFWTWYWGPQTPTDFNAVTRNTVGYPAAYGTQFAKTNALPSTMVPGWNGSNYALPDFSQWDVFSGTGGSYYIKKQNPAFADDLTKVYKNHTLKTGFYYEMTGNNQANFNPINGAFSFNGISTPLADNVTGALQGTQNPTANFLLGIASNYNEQSSLPLNDQAYKTFSFYGQDSWKVTRRFTLDYGIRFDHIGHWYDRDGYGNAVWVPGDVISDVLKGKVFPGVEWHAIDPGIPLSGTPNRLFHFSPRFGIAYDIFGTGRTVVRGGWGVYFFNDQVNDYSGPLALAQQSIQTGLPSNQTVLFSETGLLPKPGGAFQSPSSGPGTILNPSDYNVPYTTNWNLTIDQRLPWNSHLEVAYEGNDSEGLFFGGQVGGGGNLGGNDLINQNKTPLGAFFAPNPWTGSIATDPENVCGQYPDGSQVNVGGTAPCENGQADYHPYGTMNIAGKPVNVYGTQSIYVEQHSAYANYNALEALWAKQAGKFTFNTSFLWSKALGFGNGNIDPFNERANYVVLPIDRPYVWNSSYAYDLGKAYHGDNKVLGGAANGWTIAGTTTWQKGGDMQSQSSENLGMSLEYLTPFVDEGGNAATATQGISQRSFFGTDAAINVQPVETANPTSGLATSQYAKFSAFAVPAVPVGTPAELTVPKCAGLNTTGCNATGFIDTPGGATPYSVTANGPSQLPYISMPAFFDSDLAIYKTFHITERHTIEFRVTANNFLNHPLVGYSNSNFLTLKYGLDPTNKGSGYSFVAPAGNVTQANWGTTDTKYTPITSAYGRILQFGLKYAF